MLFLPSRAFRLSNHGNMRIDALEPTSLQIYFTLNHLHLAMLFIQCYHLPIRLSIKIRYHTFFVSTLQWPSQKLVVRQSYVLPKH